MKVDGLIALITGGASGFGKEFARSLLSRGAGGVSLLDVSVQEGYDTAKELSAEFGEDKVLFRKTDVTSNAEMEGSFKATLDRFQKLDVVCNNAGVADESDWQRMIDINLTAVIRGTFLAKEYMDKNNGGNGGVVINVASMAGILFVPFSPVYAGAKRGVIGFSNSLCIPGADKAFSPDNIRINTICPTFAPTNIFKNMLKSDEKAKKVMTNLAMVPVSQVIEAFMKTVDEDLHGKVIRITQEKGIDFQHFKEFETVAAATAKLNL